MLLLLLTAAPASAQDSITNLLLTNLVSRQVSVHVGGISVPEYDWLASRQVAVFVGDELTPPYRQLASRQARIVVTTPAAPARITQLTVTANPAGNIATLMWSGYNQWAEADVAGYAIYVSDHWFTNVAGLKLLRVLPGETYGVTLTNLDALRDHFFAVVPVDAAGNYDPGVNYVASYIIAQQVISRSASVFIGAEPDPPYRQVVSRQASVVVTTPAAPAPIPLLTVSATTLGDRASLSWTNYNQWAEADVAGYEVFMANQAFTTVADMTLLTNLPGETYSVSLAGLPGWQDHFFAVVPVDAAGNLNPLVNYAAAYVLAQQVISRQASLFVGADGPNPYLQVASRQASLVVSTPQPPSEVTPSNGGPVVATSTSTMSAVEVDWSGYNAWAEHDIARYRIYAQDTYLPYTNVTGLEPVMVVPAETMRCTLTNRIAYNVYHVAVVPEDVLGNFDPGVTTAQGQASVDRVPEVRNLGVRSGSNTLAFAWLAPYGADPGSNSFLAGYRVYFPGATNPLAVDRLALSLTMTNLLPAHGYPFTITTVDNIGRESPGYSLLTATLLPPPVHLAAQPLNGLVRLTWDHVAPFELLRDYTVYWANTNFTRTAGLPSVGTSGNRVDIPNLVNGQTYYFAVTATNISGGESGLGQVVSAVPNPVAGAFADLALAAVSAPACAYAGQPLTFWWTATNTGAGPTSTRDGTAVATWVDTVVWSRDGVYGNDDDVVLTNVIHSGRLEAGGGYTASATVTLPSGFLGTGFLLVMANASGDVYEALDAGTNLGVAALSLSLPPQPVLSVAGVGQGTNVGVAIEWRPSAAGCATAVNTWSNCWLEAAFSLSPPVQWRRQPQTPVYTNGAFQVILPAAAPQMFFRLSQ